MSAARLLTLTATASLALLTACTGGSSRSQVAQLDPTAAQSGPSASGGHDSPSAVAYSACMRSHGVPNFPDPDSSGRLPKAIAQQLGVSSSQLQAAQKACERVLPSSGESLSPDSLQQCEQANDCPPALVHQALEAGRNFAKCMRAHGVPNFPDPATDSEGRPYFPASEAGLSHSYTHASLFLSEVQQCNSRARDALALPLG